MILEKFCISFPKWTLIIVSVKDEGLIIHTNGGKKWSLQATMQIMWSPYLNTSLNKRFPERIKAKVHCEYLEVNDPMSEKGTYLEQQENKT